MKTDECLARADLALVQSHRQVEALHDAGAATDDLVRKTRIIIASARRAMAANPAPRVSNARREGLR